MKFDVSHVVSVLHGHTSKETAYKIENYPYGSLKCTMYAWIETVPKKGDRFVTQTVNPKNGRLNQPKKSTYADYMFLYVDSIGHLKNGVIWVNDQQVFENESFPFMFDVIGMENVSDQQKLHLRSLYKIHKAISYGYDALKYSESAKGEFLEANKTALKHIHTADFKDITKLPAMPKPDQPEKEYGYTIKQII